MICGRRDFAYACASRSPTTERNPQLTSRTDGRLRLAAESAIKPGMTPDLLLIAGSDADHGKTASDEAITGVGHTDIHQLLDRHQPYDRLHVTRNFFRHSSQPRLMPYRCLLNLITDPDQNPKVLDVLRRIVRGYQGRVINRPEAVLRSTRDQVSRMLSGIAGLIVPKTVRISVSSSDQAVRGIRKSGLEAPIILRPAGSHGGEIVGRFDSLEELGAHRLEPGKYIATRLVDFRSDDGLYRKYRVFFIGRHRIFRHMLVSDQWNIHASDRMRFMVHRRELLEEEARHFEAPDRAFSDSVSATLDAIHERMPLDFFGMDFGIVPDGQAVLFEANATMNFFPFLDDPRFDYVQQCLAPAQRAFDDMIGASPRGIHVPSLAEMLTR